MHAKYFRCLGLPEGADKSQIKRAYRKLALALHPDRNPAPEAHARFIEVTEAYEILMGERKESVDFLREWASEPVVDVREEKRKRHRERLREKARQQAKQKAKRTRAYLGVMRPIIALLALFYWTALFDLSRQAIEHQENINLVKGEYTVMGQHSVLNNYLIITATNSIYIDKVYPIPRMNGMVNYKTSPWYKIESQIQYSCDSKIYESISITPPYKHWLRNASLVFALLTSAFTLLPSRKRMMDVKVKLSFIIIFVTTFFFILFSSL